MDPSRAARVIHQRSLLFRVSWTPLSCRLLPGGPGLPVMNRRPVYTDSLPPGPTCSSPQRLALLLPTPASHGASRRNPSHWKHIHWWIVSFPQSTPGPSLLSCSSLRPLLPQSSRKLISHPPTAMRPRGLGGVCILLHHQLPQPVNHAPLFHLLQASNPSPPSPAQPPLTCFRHHVLS